MGYFLTVDPQAITGNGSTVSDEGTLTADCISNSTSEIGEVAIVQIFTNDLISTASSEVGEVELGIQATRECVSTATSEYSTIELGLNVSQIVYYDPVYS